jgi:hypothetical protein
MIQLDLGGICSMLRGIVGCDAAAHAAVIREPLVDQRFAAGTSRHEIVVLTLRQPSLRSQVRGRHTWSGS